MRMNDQTLSRTLRSIVLASLSVPLASGLAACGGIESTRSGGSDAAAPNDSSSGDAVVGNPPPCMGRGGGNCCPPPPPPADLPLDEAGLPDGSVNDAGQIAYGVCSQFCLPSKGYCGCQLTADDAGNGIVQCLACPCLGRRPAGHASARKRRGT